MYRSAAIIIAAMLSVACTQAPASPPLSPDLSSVPTAAAVATPVAQAHFAVTQLNLLTYPDDVVPGNDVQVSARVQNDGGAAGTYLAELAVDGDVVGQQELSLGAGEGIGVEFDFVAGPPGTHTVALEGATLLVEVLGPASFDQGGLTVSPNPARSGDEVEVAVVITNHGGLAGEHLVELVVDGNPVATETVTVDGGDSTTVRFPVDAGDPGPHSISVNGEEEELVVWDIERPANGTVLVNKLRGGDGRLTVENGNDRDAFIALVRPTNQSKSPLAFYVRAGDAYTMKGIKDGSYLVLYSLGHEWDRFSHRFTADADYGRFSDALPFTTTRTTYSVWTLTLHTVLGGNAPTDDLTEGEFPGLEDESGN